MSTVRCTVFVSYSVPFIGNRPHEYTLCFIYKAKEADDEADGVDAVDEVEIADGDDLPVPYYLRDVVGSSRWSR